MTFTIARFGRALEESLAASGVVAPRPAGPVRLCVALSGGLDSTVLLAAAAGLARTEPGRWTVRAVHVDHALHADSARWGEASRALCAGLGVDFISVRVDARGAPGASPEAAARDARYEALRTRLGPGEVLLTAHHADDQLETILLQWLRGGGLKAVAGMAALAPLVPNGGWHARPLLGFTRDELERWAVAQGLAWVEDPSNLDRRFDRNYLRHEVLPLLRRRWPAVSRTAGRVAAFAREALELEAAVASADLETLLRGRALDVTRLAQLPGPRRRAVLRAWLSALGLPLPTAQQLGALLHDVDVAAADRVPRTCWPGAVVHRYRGCLHAAAESDAIEPWRGGPWLDPATTPFVLGPGSSLELLPDLGQGLSRARLPDRLTVAVRVGGEVFRPAGCAHTRPLRKWLQERAVLPWRRAGLPLLEDADGRLVAVADLGCAEEFAARPGEPSWRVAWHGRGIVTEHDAFGFKWPRDPTFG